MIVKIYGASDDLVEIEGSDYEDEIGCYDSNVRIRFVDGTQIRIGYPKNGQAIWWIEVEKKGTADQELKICNDEEDDPYSDVFMIDSEIKWYRLLEQKYPE